MIIRTKGDITISINLKNSKKQIMLLIVLVSFDSFTILHIKSANAGPYLNSSHGNSSYGVKRSATGFPTDYTRGQCAHCHEAHASIDGNEPAPMGGPMKYMLFYNNYVNQTDSICFECHKSIATYQTPDFNNYSYSYRAGDAATITCPNTILSAFSFIDETGGSVSNCSSTMGTSHKLTDIKTFITGNGDTQLIQTRVLPATTLTGHKRTLIHRAAGGGLFHVQAVIPIPQPGKSGEMSQERK